MTAKRSRSTPDSSASPVPGGVARAVYGAMLATAALVAFTALVPVARDLRLWGINHLAFYPLPLRLAALALIALSLAPPVARVIYAGVLRIPAALAGGGSRSGLVITVVAVASIPMFYHFHAATNLLGDCQLLVQSYEAAEKGNTKVLMSNVDSIMKRDQISRGTTLLYYWTVKAVRDVFKRTTVEGLRLMPCILGGIFVFFLLRIVCASSIPIMMRAWILVLGLFTTALEIFFGYVENYSAIFVLLSMYACAAFLLFHRRSPLWMPVILLFAAVFMHIQAILFMPSLAFVVAWRLALGRRRLVLRYGVPVLVTLTVAVTLAARAINFPGDFYLPLFADEKSYGLLSLTHLVDILNELLMALPILGIIATMAWKTRRVEGGKDEWFAQGVEWQFVTLMIVPCVVYMVMFKAEIGMARDWDLFTMTSVGLIPLALLAVHRFAAVVGADDARVLARTFAPAMVMTVVLGVAWIGINASAERSPERYESILAYDQTHSGYAYENLAIYYYDAGKLPKAIHAMEIGARLSGNPRLYARLAIYMEENGDIAGGIKLLEQVLSRYPEHDKARAKLLDLLEKADRWPELVEVAREGVKYHPKTPVYYFALGEGLIRTGRVQEGLDVFRTCLTLNPPEGARKHIERRMKEFGQTP